jgi:hypothetical protein
MNAGLKSRLFPIISDAEADLEEKSTKEKDIYLNNIKKLLTYVQDQLLPFNYGYQTETNKEAFNTILNSFLIKIAKASDYRGIIPVSLEVTIDGIGGITIGEIFRINDDILPREYAGKGVGFIVTGISQDINRPVWNTTLQTQFCLLDQDKRQIEVRKEVDLLITDTQNLLSHDKNVIINSFALYNAFVGFFADLYFHNIEISLSNDIKTSQHNLRNAPIIITDFKYKSNPYIKYLDVALNQYKPTYDQGLVSLNDFLLQAKNILNKVLLDVYYEVKAKKGDQEAWGIEKAMIDEINGYGGYSIPNPGFHEYVLNDSSKGYKMYDQIKKVMLGTNDFPNKYLMWDPQTKYGMEPRVLQLLSSNYDSVASKALTAGYKDSIVYQQYLPEQSTNNVGAFTPKEIPNTLSLQQGGEIVNVKEATIK